MSIVIELARDAVVHPLPVATCFDDTGAPQVRKMSRDQGLAVPQYFGERTYTYLVLSEQVQ